MSLATLTLKISNGALYRTYPGTLKISLATLKLKMSLATLKLKMSLATLKLKISNGALYRT